MYRSYAIGRRAFLAGIGGALGFKLILENLEAAAVETPPPPRFLLMFWPVGTVPYQFLPVGAGTAGASFESSRILQPFDDAGLHDGMTVLFGLRHAFNAPGGGGSEAGVVFATTGVSSPGTRVNGGEADDACAGGPSFDQILLRRVPTLSHGGRRYVNAICDAQVDSNETSSRCLSYSYDTQTIESHRPGGLITEHVPLVPTLRPFDLYVEVFGSLAPEVGASQLQADLRRRRSVLDHTRRELTRLRDLAPFEQRDKLDQHAQIIRELEQELATSSETAAQCDVPDPPSPELVGKEGSKFNYGNPIAEDRDDLVHERVGTHHMNIIRAAFQCDLLRVATFQWAPSTGHIAFHDLHPGYPGKAILHHPMSHAFGSRSIVTREPQVQSEREFVEFLTNVHTWYNAKTAAILSTFRATTDVYGGNLFDQTVFPFVTDTADFSHTRSPLPVLLLGGRALGMQGGQFINLELEGPTRSSNAMWMSVAQAYLGADPLPHFADDVFDKTDAEPIAGLWRPA